MESTTPPSGPKPRRDLQGYVDETGLLRTTDPFFGLGLLVSPHINLLHRELISYRNRARYHKEFKFNDVNTQNILYYKGLIDEFFKVPNSVFSCFVYDKKNMDIQKHFKGDHNRAYNSFCGKLIADTLPILGNNHSDYITILADDVSTAKTDHFEREVKEKIKNVTRRNALSNIIRLESHAVTEIQLVDVLLGTVAYAFKINAGLMPTPNKAKLQLVKHIQKSLRIPALSTDMERKLKKGIKFRVKEIHFK